MDIIPLTEEQKERIKEKRQNRERHKLLSHFDIKRKNAAEGGLSFLPICLLEVPRRIFANNYQVESLEKMLRAFKIVLQQVPPPPIDLETSTRLRVRHWPRERFGQIRFSGSRENTKDSVRFPSAYV